MQKLLTERKTMWLIQYFSMERQKIREKGIFLVMDKSIVASNTKIEAILWEVQMKGFNTNSLSLLKVIKQWCWSLICN